MKQSLAMWALAAGLFGALTTTAILVFADGGNCCKPGASCCVPGAVCCAAHHHPAAEH